VDAQFVEVRSQVGKRDDGRVGVEDVPLHDPVPLRNESRAHFLPLPREVLGR
jgi:hypothetical protein